jgi:uncharacterized protein involved in type VI secretion and phage assembly
MSGRLLSAMKGHAGAMISNVAVPRWATVESVDAVNHVVKVTMQPEGVLTDWIPLVTLTTGNGWGGVFIPKPGQQVLTIFENGDGGNPVVLGAAYSAQNKPPKPAAAIGGDGVTPVAGEFIWTHEKGAVLRFADDGSIYMKTAYGLNIEANTKIKGTLEVTENITGDKDVLDAHGSMDRLRGHHNLHTHGGVQGGTSSTTAPNSGTDPE